MASTYHCPSPCLALLLTTAHPLPLFPRRTPPAQDKAFIVPLSGSASPDHAGVAAELTPGATSTAVGRPLVVRREDGFEKRRTVRCAQCGAGLGYWIVGDDESMEGSEEVDRKVLYLLDTGVVETGQL